MFEFQLPDLSCSHCVAAVTQALKAADPAATVAVDLPQHTVQVTSGLPRAAIAAALTEAGYPPA